MLVPSGMSPDPALEWISSRYGSRLILQPGVGNIAINDAFMLEAAIYHLLKKHFRQQTYYVDLLELFLEVSYLVPVDE